MDTNFSKQVRRVCEVMMFENWLRFYFIVEENDKLFLRLPAEAEQRIQERYAFFSSLLLDLKDKEVTHENSLNSICIFVAANIESEQAGLKCENIFDSPSFHAEMQLFGLWVQNHEDQLDAAFSEFKVWMQMFDEWKKTPKVQEYMQKMKTEQQITVQSCETVQ